MISAKQLFERVHYLSHTIGTRMAGTEEERKAAEYLMEGFGQVVPKCMMEPFPVNSQRAVVECFQIYASGKWSFFSASLYNGAPTTNGRSVEAEIVFFDSHTDYQRKDLSYLHDKAVLHFGASAPDEESYARLMAVKPAFLLMVDTNYTNSVPLNDGLLPAHVAKYGAVPTMSVSFYDAWKWFQLNATRARLRVSGGNQIAQSQNVIAEIPGTDQEACCIYLGSHMDSVAGSPGADDNAIGCAILLEAAKELAEKPHRNTIKLISFGSEEQLSVGSAEYVRKHDREIEKKGRFMMNFDSCGSLIGWNKFVMNAEDELRKEIKEFFNSRNIYYVERLNPDPCNDLFPFTVLGVPGLTVMRNNCESGKFFHHRFDNDISNISFDIAADLANAAVEWVSDLADRNLQTFYRTNQKNCAEVGQIWRSDYGGFEYQLKTAEDSK